MKTSALTDRWTKAEIRRIGRALTFGRFPRGLAFIEHDGQVYSDLRGIVWEHDIDCDLDHVDLSYGDLSRGGGIISMTPRGHRVVDCRFVGTRLWCLLAADFERCDFSRASMKGCNLRGDCTDCSFRETNMISLDGGHQRFVRCDFRGAKLRRASMNFCRFEDCRWDGAVFGSGVMVDCTFVGPRPTAEQFGDTMVQSDDPPELVAEVEAEVQREVAAQAAERRRQQRQRRRKRR